MLRRLRENGPAVLVPAIWSVVAGAHLGVVSGHTLFVAHVVMSAILVAFVGLSWGDMRTGVLRAWRLVILAGTPLALAGTAGLAIGGDAPLAPLLLGVAVVGWMLVPAPALGYTGRRVDRHPVAYTGGAIASAVGAVVYAGGVLVGGGTAVLVGAVLLVGVGQTAGIVAAVVDY